MTKYSWHILFQFYKGDSFWDFQFAFKEVNSSAGSKFFLFRVDPFFRGSQANFDGVVSKSVSIPLKLIQ